MYLKVVGWLTLKEMDKKEGLKLLKEIIGEEIVHQDHDRVTKLRDHYYKLKTGDGIEDLLHRIETRVTEDEFAQIKKIYRSIIPSTLNSTKLPFEKAARKQPIVRKIDYEGDAESKKLELEKYIGKYWGDKSLEEYLEYAFIDYNYIDPNAFLITEFSNFDNKKEKAKPYPFIASSAEAIMFEYHNEILQYLVVKLPIKFMDGETERDGFKFTMYLGPDTIVLSEVAQSVEALKIKSKYYKLSYFQPKTDKVPASRFGFLRDAQTKGRTFVSVFHCVLELLEKTLKIDSELDLSCAMVAFPQRFAYGPPCPGGEKGCINGKTLDGHICPVCKGTDIAPAHAGTQHIIYLKLPRDISQPLWDLEKMLVYKGPPIELLQFDSDYLENLEKKVHAKMFNADLYTRSEVSTTATEKILETDNLNDTLYPFARSYSITWEFVVKDIATFTDLGEGLIVQHKFPNDFKFKTLRELMEELQVAKSAGASTSTIAAIEDDINEILYSDRPEALKEMRIKNQINPFRGYSEANIRFIISQDNVPKYSSTLWENLESIFQDLEVENTDPWLYDLSYDLIVKKVQAKTDEYIKRIADEKKVEMDLYMAQEEKTNFNKE